MQHTHVPAISISGQLSLLFSRVSEYLSHTNNLFIWGSHIYSVLYLTNPQLTWSLSWQSASYPNCSVLVATHCCPWKFRHLDCFRKLVHFLSQIHGFSKIQGTLWHIVIPSGLEPHLQGGDIGIYLEFKERISNFITIIPKEMDFAQLISIFAGMVPLPCHKICTFGMPNLYSWPRESTREKLPRWEKWSRCNIFVAIPEQSIQISKT